MKPALNSGEVLRQAIAMAKRSGMFVLQKSDNNGNYYLLYRISRPKNTLICRKKTVYELRRAVRKAAGSKKEEHA